MPAAKRSKAVDELIEGALKAARYHPGEYLEGKRILLVDGNARGLEALAALLRHMADDDLEMSTARGFTAALDICRSHEGGFDLVLIGHVIGGRRTGLDLLAELRRAGLPAETLCVLFADDMSTDLRRAARAAGFQDAIATLDLDEDSLFAVLVRHWEAPSRHSSE